MIVRAGKSEILEYTGSLEIQIRVDVVIFTLKCIGQASSVETQAGLLCYSLEAEFQETSVVPLKALTDWKSPTHIMNGNLFYLTSTDCRC